MRKPLVYVAGPITGDPFGCVRQALPVFHALREAGCVPFLPQLSILAEIVQPIPYDEWLAYDFDVIALCDGLVRLPGASAGADREVELAGELGVRVLAGYTLAELLADIPAWGRSFGLVAPLGGVAEDFDPSVLVDPGNPTQAERVAWGLPEGWPHG